MINVFGEKDHEAKFKNIENKPFAIPASSPH